MNRAVNDLLNKFEYPNIDTRGGTVIGGGGGAPTVVVAASDATELSIAKADFLCNGSADHVEIQQALDLMQDTGGRLVLTEGNFNVSTDEIVVPAGADVHIMGMNRNDTTVLVYTGTGTVLSLSDDCTVSDLTIAPA